MVIEALDNLVDKLVGIRDDIGDLLAQAMESLAWVVRAMNEEQLEDGKRRDGSVLPNYSPGSVAKFGKRPGPMTLKDTGAFRSKITVKANATFAEIISTDSKTGILEAKYELTIVGIPDDRIDEFILEYLLPTLQELIRRKYFNR
jgi:hypothetical protein